MIHNPPPGYRDRPTLPCCAHCAHRWGVDECMTCIWPETNSERLTDGGDATPTGICRHFRIRAQDQPEPDRCCNEWKEILEGFACLPPQRRDGWIRQIILAFDGIDPKDLDRTATNLQGRYSVCSAMFEGIDQ